MLCTLDFPLKPHCYLIILYAEVVSVVSLTIDAQSYSKNSRLVRNNCITNNIKARNAYIPVVLGRHFVQQISRMLWLPES